MMINEDEAAKAVAWLVAEMSHCERAETEELARCGQLTAILQFLELFPQFRGGRLCGPLMRQRDDLLQAAVKSALPQKGRGRSRMGLSEASIRATALAGVRVLAEVSDPYTSVPLPVEEARDFVAEVLTGAGIKISAKKLKQWEHDWLQDQPFDPVNLLEQASPHAFCKMARETMLKQILEHRLVPKVAVGNVLRATCEQFSKRGS